MMVILLKIWLFLIIVSTTSAMIGVLVFFMLQQPLDQCPIAALTSKSQGQISSRKHELCNLQENLTGNHNSILPTIYINYPWSVLQLCICCVSYPNIHALFSCPITHPPYIYLKASILFIFALMSYPKPYSSSLSSMHASYVHHEETMLLTCSLTSLPLQTFLNPSKPQILLDCSRPYDIQSILLSLIVD